MSVGKFGDSIFACEMLTGFASVPEYHQISAAEFETFEQWSNADKTDLKKLYEIINRPVICSGYRDRAELNMSLIEKDD